MQLNNLPVYSWERARSGDASDPITCMVSTEQLGLYTALFSTVANSGSAVPNLLPAVFVRLFAPLRRHEAIARQGASYPQHPTPAVQWHCTLLGPVRVGEPVVSVTTVHGKFIRRDRHFLQWCVQARHEDGEPLAQFLYTNLWDEGRAEDRQR